MNGVHIYRFTPFPLQGANATRHAPTPKRERELDIFFTQNRFPVCDLRLGDMRELGRRGVGGVVLSSDPGDQTGSKVDQFEPLSAAGLGHPAINDASSRTGEVSGTPPTVSPSLIALTVAAELASPDNSLWVAGSSSLKYTHADGSVMCAVCLSLT